MREQILCAGFVLAMVGCAGNTIEDGVDDAFAGGDKADAFAVEDAAPDGAAVLKLVSTASQAKLEDEVGLSDRVAKSIVAARATLPGKVFTNLKDLDAAPYVGQTVFDALLHYVTEHHLFNTSFRIPLFIEKEDDQSNIPLTTYNTQARSVGLPPFARWAYVDKGTDFEAAMTALDKQLDALAAKAHITLPGKMLRYAYDYADYADSTQSICYLGDGAQVGDLAHAQAGTMVGEMYQLWGWKFGAKKFIADGIDDDPAVMGEDWGKYSTRSKEVLMVFSNSDGGDEASSEAIKPCR